MPDWAAVVAAASLVVAVFGYIGLTWGRLGNAQAARDEWRSRDEGHVADLAESRAETAESRAETAAAQAQIAELSGHVMALHTSLQGQAEWTEVIRILGQIIATLDEIKAQNEARS